MFNILYTRWTMCPDMKLDEWLESSWKKKENKLKT